MCRWSTDSRSLFVKTLSPDWPLRVYRFDVATGRRDLWKEFVPSDLAGLDEPSAGGGLIQMTPDGKFYTFSFRTYLSELFVVDRAR
jgi:hypothetical protein